MEAVNIFFLGKGGVGKSTSSALTALSLARRGDDVLLVSLDPAHNQADIFESRFSDKPRRVAPHLEVVEIDQERWIEKYLKGVHEEINRNYRYLTAFNLEKHFEVMRYSPGLEEYALILAFEETRKRYPDHRYMVWDMAPTALSLKFFNLPGLSLVWINQLLALRKEIIAKRELITKVRLLDREVETDKVLRRLERSVEEYTALARLFQDSARTRIELVLNPDRLSLAESRRIVTELRRIGIRLHQVVVNKVWDGASLEDLKQEFRGLPMVTVPQSETQLIGLDVLVAYLDDKGLDFHEA
ncbi:MAG: ArsA family ATPase [Acidobacteria bacterium]|nr:ArsA family ATPase [Acidobacteriota bacterium]